MAVPESVPVGALVRDAENFAEEGLIDPLENLVDDRVYVYHAERDQAVNFAAGRFVQEFYSNFVPSRQITLEDGIDSSHGMVIK
jgi:hypothetical protein